MELKFQPDQEVVITLLGRPGPSTPGKILNLIGRTMQLLADLPAEAGSLVKIEWNRCLVLGEVHELQRGNQLLSVEIEHAVLDLEQLAQQRQLWLSHSLR